MNYLTEIIEIAEKAGFKMSDICREAGIDQAQLSRWLAGHTVPLISSIDKLRAATDRLIAGRIETLSKVGQP
jgi:transcriptional regulator with XRE-family HTH domain